MYSFIKGIIDSINENRVVIDCGGMGYEITLSSFSLSRLGRQGSAAKVYTYMHVREDGVSLFGFATQEEKAMFIKLIGVSGIGPKLAMSVLSGVDAATLAVAVITGDAASLSKIKGVGKKTAERIILELKENISEETVRSALIPSAGGAPDITKDNAVSDALTALSALGISRTEAFAAVIAARENANDPGEIMKLALKKLDR